MHRHSKKHVAEAVCVIHCVQCTTLTVMVKGLLQLGTMEVPMQCREILFLNVPVVSARCKVYVDTDSSFAVSGPHVQFSQCICTLTGTVNLMNCVPINAKSILQKITTNSSCYAETITLHTAAKETMAMHNLFQEAPDEA